MFGVIMPLCNRMFCCIFGWYFFTNSRLKYEKIVLFSSSRAFLLSTPTFLLSTPVDKSEATWKKATKCNKNKYHCRKFKFVCSFWRKLKTLKTFSKLSGWILYHWLNHHWTRNWQNATILLITTASSPRFEQIQL